jgi:MFS family permease
VYSRRVSKAKLGISYWKLWSATAVSNLGDGISMVAYPWLASATTRSPMLIALVPLAQRLPWLIFTLPAGVITDRYDRRKIIVAMDFLRGILTAVVGIGVYLSSSRLPSLKNVTHAHPTQLKLYLLLVITALLFGFMEVLRDNSAQTLMPSVVAEEQLQKANGQMWSAESLTNSFIGPPLGSLLLGAAMALPFFVDAATFFFCAGLIGTLAGTFRPGKSGAPRTSFHIEIKEGISWLWHHQLLRSMGIILGLLNFCGSITGAIYILFAQEVLHASVFIFAILGTAGAVGGILGGTLGPRVTAKIGSGPSLALALLGMPTLTLVTGLTSSWKVVWVTSAIEAFLAVLWNVITVSLRQSIIPSALLGRVNSVYRLLAWGTIPIATLFGGLLVTVNVHFMNREWALRSTFLVATALGVVLFFYAVPKLTTKKIEAARLGGAPTI